MKLNLKITIITFLFLTLCSFSQQGKDKPCSSKEAHQFDFWVGNWKAEWKNKDGKTVSGSNLVKRILGGCVIEENFNGNPGTPLVGKSFSVYNTKLNEWKQTWVDNQGGYLNFSGKFSNNKMILQRSAIDKKGNRFLQRMIYYNITENSFVWNWEISRDNGKSWDLRWQIHYSRIINADK